MQENIKQIKEQLILKHFNFNHEYKPNTKYDYCYSKSDRLDIKGYIFSVCPDKSKLAYLLWEFNNNIVMQISETGNLIFAFQHYEKNRNEIKKVLNDYLNKNVFHNLILKDKLEDKLVKIDIIKQKVNKI